MKTITGSFANALGSPASQGILQFRLSQDASSSGGQISPYPFILTLDVNGNIPANTQIWANDELSPSTFYKVQLFDAVSTVVIFGPERWVIQGNSPINLNTLTSTQNSF